jgi:hypothetical protein
MPELFAAFEVPSQALIQCSDDNCRVMSLSLIRITPLGVLMLLISTLSGLEPSMISTGESVAKLLLSISSGAGMDPSMTPEVETTMGSLPPKEVIHLIHEPQTVTGVSLKSEGCLVWKGKRKLNQLPGCNP